MTGSDPRDSRLARLEAEPIDVLVVGAGIAGAASAAALTAGGASVALVDRGDFGAGTSQESSNLVWGGLKYLENGEVGLVARLCAARNRLLDAFPSRVRETRFIAAVERSQRGFTRTAAALLAGGWAYWLLGRGRTRAPRWLGAERLAKRAPMMARDRFRGALEYSDAVLVDHDARFVFSFVREAARRGAVCANYVEVTGARREGDLWFVDAVDRDGGPPRTIRARVLVNAAGPYVDALNAGYGVETHTHLVFSKGIHLIVDRLAPEDRVLAFFDEQDRPFFVIPLGGRSSIGTTDTSVASPETVVTPEDRRFLLDHVNARLARGAPLTEEDVVAERCGVRALAVEGKPSPGESWLSMSRRHTIEVDAARGHLSIFGGKLTDCLNVGEEVVQAVRGLGLDVVRPASWFGEPPAERRAAFRKAAEDVVATGIADRLWRRYGEDAFAMIEAIRADDTLAEPILSGAEVRRCEVRHAARHEMVVTLEDFLRRRTRLALVTRHRELLEDEPGMRTLAEALFGADGARRLAEWRSVAQAPS